MWHKYRSIIYLFREQAAAISSAIDVGPLLLHICGPHCDVKDVAKAMDFHVQGFRSFSYQIEILLVDYYSKCSKCVLIENYFIDEFVVSSKIKLSSVDTFSLENGV